MAWSLQFAAVQNSGIKEKGFGFRVEGLGLRVRSLVFRA
jgi:hypothetical protein